MTPTSPPESDSHDTVIRQPLTAAGLSRSVPGLRTEVRSHSRCAGAPNACRILPTEPLHLVLRCRASHLAFAAWINSFARIQDLDASTGVPTRVQIHRQKGGVVVTERSGGQNPSYKFKDPTLFCSRSPPPLGCSKSDRMPAIIITQLSLFLPSEGRGGDFEGDFEGWGLIVLKTKLPKIT